MTKEVIFSKVLEGGSSEGAREGEEDNSLNCLKIEKRRTLKKGLFSLNSMIERR